MLPTIYKFYLHKHRASVLLLKLFYLLREKMPNRCVAAGCSNVPDPSKSIGLHKFPEDNDLEKKRRRLWVAFVRTKRAKWSPTATSRLCSQHFKADDFESPFITIPGTTFVSRAVLKKDAIPTIHSDKAEPSNVEHDIVDSRSNREHRSVSKTVQIYLYTLCFCIYLEIYLTSLLLSYFCLTNMRLYFA